MREDLTLEPQSIAATPPSVRCCDTCAFFQHAKGPTGRMRRGERGECTWQPRDTAYPTAWINPPTPGTVPMWPASGAACPCWREA